jgi:hypothetical protein
VDALLIPQGTMADTDMSGRELFWDLVMGSTTIARWWSVTASDEAQRGPVPCEPFLTDIPVDTQLKVSAASNSTAEAQDVAAYCFYSK